MNIFSEQSLENEVKHLSLFYPELNIQLFFLHYSFTAQSQGM
jgi:hypothetical protein